MRGVLSEVSQTEKGQYSVILLIYMESKSKQANKKPELIETENRHREQIGGCRVGGGRNG